MRPLAPSEWRAAHGSTIGVMNNPSGIGDPLKSSTGPGATPNRKSIP